MHNRGIFAGTGVVRGELHDCGAYPGLTRGEGRVRGDVFRVGPQLLRYLDAFESEEFGRERLIARMDNGGIMRVWVYLVRNIPGTASG